MQSLPLGIVRVGIVGLGARGLTALRLLALLDEARVTALCDLSSKAMEAAKVLLQEAEASVGRKQTDRQATLLTAHGADAFQTLCHSPLVDLIYICSDWQTHAPIALEAMRAGKHVAIEVPAATTMEELWALVHTAEQTQRHCVLLENCLYDPDIQQAIQCIHEGGIGQVVHAEGAYYHHLGDRWTDWRLAINHQWCGDLYPTHELGPICMALDINRTDSLQTLVSMDSAAITGPELVCERTGQQPEHFCNGDHTTTLIRTARGVTILLKHDVMNPQPYDRSIHVIGTRGDIRAGVEGPDAEIVCTSFRSIHDPMTYEMNRHLIHSLAVGVPTDTDVYDLATWCAVIPLSQQSIRQGCAPVTFPNFRADRPRDAASPRMH